jgi:CubicO group peptidase (beta-lactamase class C family)
MKRIYFLLALNLLGRFTIAQTPKNTDFREAFVVIDRWLSAQKDFDRLPGIAVSIVRDQQVIWSKGYGYANVEKKLPMEPETICSICSISKLFTSIAVMQLVEQGKIHLDDSISADLPSFNLKQQYPESGPITIRSLLSHSSGLPRESEYPYWSAPDFNFPTEKQVTDKLGSQQTLYPASTYFQYSNLGMSILGELVEHVSGKPYEQYVQENILQPLQLSDTRPFLPENLWGDKMAFGYGGIHRDGHRDKMPLFQAKGIAPAAGYSSSASDLSKFASWQFRLLAKGGTEVIKASTLRDMQRVQFLDPDWKTAYGLGFAVRDFNDNTLVGHGGSCPGYLTLLTMDTKEKLGIIVMLNGQGENPNKYAEAIYKILKLASQLDLTSANGTDLEQYSGNYDSYAFGNETIVFKWKGKLGAITARGADPAANFTFYKHISGDVFRRVRKDDTLGEELRFEKDQQGKVIRMWNHSNYYNKLPG